MVRVIGPRGARTERLEDDKTTVTQVRAVWAFAPEVEENQLPFPVGAIINVTGQMPVASGWWHGEYEEKKGLFPINYTEVYQVEKFAYKTVRLSTTAVSSRIRNLQAQLGKADPPAPMATPVASVDPLPIPVPKLSPKPEDAHEADSEAEEEESESGELGEPKEEKEEEEEEEEEESETSEAAEKSEAVEENGEEEGEESSTTSSVSEVSKSASEGALASSTDEEVTRSLLVEHSDEFKEELIAVIVEQPQEPSQPDPKPIELASAKEDSGQDDIGEFLEKQASDLPSVPVQAKIAPPMTWEEACKAGDSRAIGVLLSEGKKIDQQDREGRTGLHLAALHGHYDLVVFLLQNKANIGIFDKQKQLPHTQSGCSTNMRRVLLSNVTTQPRWVPDETSSTCLICSSTFTFFHRRHHCRNCGILACGACAGFSRRLPQLYVGSAEQRVCSYCHPILTMEKE